MNRSAESAVAGCGGAALGGVIGAQFGLAVPAVVVGGINGALAGWRQIYRWSSPVGWLAFALDSTWALLTTTSATVAHLFAAIRRDRSFDQRLSERQNRFVYRRGLVIRRKFLITFGNTVCGAGESAECELSPRRARLVADHEDVHVWQARWFGPFFPVLYGLWMALGGAFGGLMWLLKRRQQGFFHMVESYAYYLNPFEWWAYSRDDSWPPAGKAHGVGPQRPMCKPFVLTRNAAKR